jgi:threonine synthase
MRTFAASGELDLSGEPAADASSSCLCAGAGDTQATLETIREYDARHGYLLDPHTAVGVAVGRRLRAAGEPLICLATAHPAKFGDAIGRALGRDAAHHPLIDALRDLPTRCEVLPNDVETVRGYLRTALGEGEDEDGR